jgi:uncharacterized membrane protein YsdA (DUF1294 family)
MWRLTMLVLFVDVLGLGSLGYFASILPGAGLERIAGGWWTQVALLVGVLLVILGGPMRWSYHSILALGSQAASRRKWFARDLLRASWFLALPLALLVAILARRAFLGSIREPRLALLLRGLPEYAAWTLALSVTTFLLYGEDKFVAKERETAPDLSSRIRESNLNWLAFLGGWPGALAAQSAFRHKTVDARFRAFFFLAIAGHLALIGLLAYRIARG